MDNGVAEVLRLHTEQDAANFADLKAEFRQARHELKSEMAALRVELKETRDVVLKAQGAKGVMLILFAGIGTALGLFINWWK